MKKLIAALLIASLALTGCAFAETYVDPDNRLTFEYDDTCLEIVQEDVADDELLVILNGTVQSWGATGITLYLYDMEDGESFPALEDFADMEQELNIDVVQGEWNGFANVFMYDIAEGDGIESVFIVPIYDDDDPSDVDDVLTITITVEKADDEESAMDRDDAISEIVDTLKVLDD